MTRPFYNRWHIIITTDEWLVTETDAPANRLITFITTQPPSSHHFRPAVKFLHCLKPTHVYYITHSDYCMWSCKNIVLIPTKEWYNFTKINTWEDSQSIYSQHRNIVCFLHQSNKHKCATTNTVIQQLYSSYSNKLNGITNMAHLFDRKYVLVWLWLPKNIRYLIVYGSLSMLLCL